MFSIRSITILSDCKHIKNLEEGVYSFDNPAIRNFYGDRVSLHAIVGKNGSGKSSLLDIILRMVNNLGAVLVKEEPRNAAEDMCYVLGIYADLRYTVDLAVGEREACLKCRDKAIWIECDGHVYWLSAYTLLDHEVTEDRYYNDCLQAVGQQNMTVWLRTNTLDQQQEIANRFFYTIATNYSMYGFLSPDYEEEDSMRYAFIAEQDRAGNVVMENGYPVGQYQWVAQKNWINSLFHKNDGYMSPAVLNPYRDDAKLDMENETNLTVQRLTSLLICGNTLLDDYELGEVKYELHENFTHKLKYSASKSWQEVLNDFVDFATDRDYYAFEILRITGCELRGGNTELEKVTAMYIVYKILHIAVTYPSYVARFSGVGGINSIMERIPDGNKRIVVAALAREVMNNSSHIEQKVKQAVGFFCWAIGNRDRQAELGNEFSYASYKAKRGLPTYTKEQLQDCLDTLPPAIFKQKLKLNRRLENGDWTRDIPMERISSGEKQLMYQLSTIAYHMININSVSPARLRYHNINILLDEIEICYHPDFQRGFIDRLLEVLKNLPFYERFRIHILITTHSPFILSDVMSTQIMYLQEGHQLTGKELEKMMNPFAANVNDILHQSFFLSEGFIGRYAQKKIMEAANFLWGKPIENKTQEWTIEDVDKLIKSIDEPYIRHQMEALYDAWIANHLGMEGKRELAERLKGEQERLTLRIRQLEEVEHEENPN